MTLKTRRILYISFIILFFTITPLVFLYASGYSLSRGFKIQKTGMLIIDTKPKGAKIYLNNQPRKEFFKNFFKNKNYITTPTKIKNITPGEYEVRLEMENYWPWQKKLYIMPGETTFAEDIFLFKKDLPLLLESAKNAFFSYSPDKKYFFVINDNFAGFYSVENDIIKKYIFSTSSPVIDDDVKIIWSMDSRKVIAGNFIFDYENIYKPVNIIALIGDQAKDLKWDPEDRDKIFYKLNNALLSYNLYTKQYLPIINNCYCSDYLPKNGKINIALENKDSDKLSDIDGKLLNTFELPNANYTYINYASEFLNIYDNDHKILYLIDPNLKIKPLQHTINNITTSFWVDKSKLLYANDYEVWIYNLEGKNNNLLTRVSNKIKNVIWHPSNNYIIFTTEKDINILELDNREKYNITKIIEFDKITNSYLSADGSILYFYGQIGNQEGLYKLSL